MRVQLATAPKTRIHFREDCSDGEMSWKENRGHELNYKFYLKEDTLKTQYRNGTISARKLRKGLERLADQEEAAKNCLENNFDSNGKWIAKVVKEESFGEKLYTLYRYLRLNSRKLIKK